MSYEPNSGHAQPDTKRGYTVNEANFNTQVFCHSSTACLCTGVSVCVCVCAIMYAICFYLSKILFVKIPFVKN